MTFQARPLRPSFYVSIWVLAVILALLPTFAGCSRKSSAQTTTTDLNVKVGDTFRFVAYGDSRFHNPKDTEAANPPVRAALVRAVANADPKFICFTGDIVYSGSDADDWKVYDTETTIWREKNIPVFPALGNHEFHGNEKIALGNYFQHFPDLKNSRYYSVRAGNALFLALDSSLDEVSGPQGQWLAGKLAQVPPDVDFVFLMLHHPPYTSSSMNMVGNGHSARSEERALAGILEERQKHSRARFVVFAGHVHNYERHEHGGVTYFVSGGGGAHAYPVQRSPNDLFQGSGINYHYLLVEVDHQKLKVTMNRLEIVQGKEVWTRPDQVEITAPTAVFDAARPK